MTDVLPQNELNQRHPSSTTALGFIPGDERVLKAVQTKMGPQHDRVGSDIVMATQEARETEKPASPEKLGNMWDEAWDKAWTKAQEDWDKGKSVVKPDPFSIKPDFSAVNKELEKAILATVDSGELSTLLNLETAIDKHVKTERSSPILKKKENGNIEIHHIRQIRMSPDEQKFFDERPNLSEALEMTVIGSGRLGYGKRLAPIHVIKPPKKPATEGKTG